MPFAERLIKGSSNFRKSAAATHFTPEMHLSAVKLEEKEKCDREGKVHQVKVSFSDPAKSNFNWVKHEKNGKTNR